MPTTEIETAEKQAKAEIELANALDRLVDNPDFKLLIEGEFLTNYPNKMSRNLVRELPQQRAATMDRLLGVSVLDEFFTTIQQKRSLANKRIADLLEEAEIVNREED